VFPMGCKPGSESNKPVTLESDVATKESLDAPAAPASVAPKAEATKPMPPKTEENAPEQPAKSAAVVESPSGETAAPSKPGLSLAEVTPVQAERALREALRLALKNTAARLGRKGGIGDDAGARIPFPEEWRSMETAVRKVDRGRSVDALLALLNAAAERAAADLGAKLEPLIAGADLGDAKGALTSSADGATQAFLTAAEERIQSAVREVAAKALAGAGVESALEAVMEDARFANPFTNIRNVDGFDLPAWLGDQLAERALVAMAGEERALRENPDRLESEQSAAVFEAAK
jgi:hypothetical protein